MKKVIVASAALFFAAISSNVKAATISRKAPIICSINSDSTETRTAVKPEELPEAVKQTLASDDYKGWTPSTLFLVKGGTEYYEVTLTKEGSQANTVKIDKEGKKL